MAESIALPEKAFSGRRGNGTESADISEASFDSTMIRRDQASSVDEGTLGITSCLNAVCWNLRLAQTGRGSNETES